MVLFYHLGLEAEGGEARNEDGSRFKCLRRLTPGSLFYVRLGRGDSSGRPVLERLPQPTPEGRRPLLYNITVSFSGLYFPSGSGDITAYISGPTSAACKVGRK